ncbi:MAG TPA: NAD-dependent epimerase/dehydratase family protein [Ktedonobacterales bacterium]|nr:NAD-dependent epimerase/dehydratase family protein [Ktedonobacterales bacterium]
MEILITGASGLLGHHLISALQERGDHVRALVLPREDASKLEARGVTIFRGDVCQPESLEQPCIGVDIVYHLAGMMGVWLPLEAYRAVNVDGAENMCRAALRAQVRRLVHISSWTVYGMALGWPARENFPLDPFPEPYALTKAEGDRMVQRLIAREHLPATIVRPGTFFGPGDRLHFGRMADRLRDGKGIVVGNGQNALPFVYVTDVVRGLLAAGSQDVAIGQAYNITNDQPLTQEEILCAIAEEIGVPAPRLHVPYSMLYAAAYAAEKVAAVTHARTQPIVTRLGVKLFGTDNRHSIEKARVQLGYAPRVSLHEGIRLAAEWYRNGAPALTATVPTVV